MVRWLRRRPHPRILTAGMGYRSPNIELWTYAQLGIRHICNRRDDPPAVMAGVLSFCSALAPLPHGQASLTRLGRFFFSYPNGQASVTRLGRALFSYLNGQASSFPQEALVENFFSDLLDAVHSHGQHAQYSGNMNMGEQDNS